MRRSELIREVGKDTGFPQKLVKVVLASIEVEGQELPIPAILNKCKISSCMYKEDSDKVLHALKIKGVIAKRHTGINDDYFVVEDLV